jgi:beta-lactamase class D
MVLLAATALAPHAGSAEISARREIRPELARRFADDGTEGAFAAYDVTASQLIASDGKRCETAFLPASTFKIPNSLIALDTGVVSDPDNDVFKWDGVKRPFDAWNRDHTLRSAIAASAVPVYQEIARRIGAERMQRYLDAFEYGNRNIGGGIDRFWLTGDLRTSAFEQIDFLDRLRRRALPASSRAQEITRDIMPVTKAGEALIYNKTGFVGVDDRTRAGEVRPALGWIVGWADKENKQTLFALNLDIREDRHVGSRMKLTQQLLADVGAI